MTCTIMLFFIPRDEEGLLHVHTPKKGPLLLPLFRIEIFLAARPTASIRGMNGRNHSIGVFRVQIGSPVLRTSGIGANCIRARKRHTVAGSLASSASVAGVAEPAEQRAEGNETAGCDTEAGFDVGPDGDVDGGVCGKKRR